MRRASRLQSLFLFVPALSLGALATSASAQPPATSSPSSKPTAPPKTAPPKTAPPKTAPPKTAPATAAAAAAQVAVVPKPPPAAGKRHLDVLFTGDIYGRYAWPGCRKRPKNKPSLARLANAIRAQRQNRTGAAAPLLVHAGSLLRPDIMGNFLFRDAPKLAPQVGKVFAQLGFDGLAVGLFDFGATPVAFRRFRQVMAKAGVPLLASNVSCTKGKSGAATRCEGLRHAQSPEPYRVVTRGQLKVGIFSVLRGDLQRRILRHGDGELRAADPVAFSRALIRKLRSKERVDLVVVLANLNLENTAPRPVLSYLRALGDDAPDLVVANAMYERGAKKTYLQQIRRGRTVVVGTDRFAQHLGQVRLELRRGKAGWTIEDARVRHHAVASFPADPKLEPVVEGFLEALCKEVDTPIGKGVFKNPISYHGFLDYMMQIMRKRSRAEVGVINDSGIADTSFPMHGRLTWEKILRAIRTETEVGHVKVTGARLKAVLGKYVGKKAYGLRIIGLTKKGKRWLVNGRPLIKGHTYRVATSRFIAKGGDGLASFSRRESFHGLGVSLRDLATDFFGADGEADYDEKLNINVKHDFPHLGDEWLFYGDLSAGFGLSSVTVSNGASNTRYSLPLLRRNDLVTLAGNIDASIGASTRDHQLELDLSLNYGKTWTTVKVEDPEGSGNYEDQTTDAESLDRITATLLYKLRALRNKYGGQWYVPEPYGEVRLISEFTASGECDPLVCTNADDQTYHYMDLGGTVGLGLTLHPLFFLKLGAVMRGELLTPEDANPDITAKPGIYLGYLLRRWKVLPDPLHPLELESRLDFYFTDFGGQLRRELTLASKFYFSLTRRLALTVAHRLYVFDKRCKADDTQCNAQGDDLSVANDITVGLSVRLDFRLQTF